MIEDHEDIRQSQAYRRRWWTLVVLSLSVLTVVLGTTIINVALPTLQRELGTTGADLQWIMDSYILALAALVLTMGSLGDRLGRSYMLRAGMFVFAAASLAAAFADSAGHLIIGRAFMGIGAAMIMPATLAIIANVFPREERGRAIGAWGAMNGSGVALGPIIGGAIVEHYSWNAIFWINVPIIAAGLIAAWFLVPNSRDPHPKPLDLMGTVLSAAALSSLVFGLIKGGDWGWTDVTVLGTLIGAVAIGLLFVVWERHTVSPMVDIRLFRHPRFSAGVGTVAIVSIMVQGMFFAATLYLQFVHGYSPLKTGVLFLPSAIGFAWGSISSPQRVSRFGTSRVMATGLLGVVLMAAVYSLWNVETPYWQIGLAFFFWAFCLGNVFTPSMDSVLGALPEARAGVGSAMNNVATQVGGAVGIAALGAILASVYTSNIEPVLAAIPEIPSQAVEAARDSVGAAVLVAETMPSDIGNVIIDAAGLSFMDGWQVITLVVSGIAVVAAAFVLKFMPPRHMARAGEEEVGVEPSLKGADLSLEL